MGEKDPEKEVDKDDELVAVESFEVSAVPVPGSLLARLVEARLFLLPHEEGGAECFHGHHDVDLHPYTFLWSFWEDAADTSFVWCPETDCSR